MKNWITFLKRWRYVFYGLHAILLIVVTLWLQRLLFLYKDEASIIRFATLIKTLFIPDNKPAPEDFLFINTSADNVLIELYDETGIVPIGNTPITDRKKLVELYSIINRNPRHKYIICDIFFNTPTKHDNQLGYLFENTPNTIMSYLLDNKDQKMLPLIGGNNGAAVVEILDQKFAKFKLSWNDSTRSMPLQTIIDLEKADFQHGTILSSLNGRPILNTFFLNYRITTYDLQVKKSYPMINLGELLLLGEENISELMANRWVMIGDFEKNDKIETLFGTMPGPLLLLNAILALKNRDMQVSLIYLGFLFGAFFFISSIIFNPGDMIAVFLSRLKLGEGFSNFLKGLSMLLVLSTISILSFLIFHIHVNILLLSIYLYIIDFVIRKKFRKQRPNHIMVTARARKILRVKKIKKKLK